jgi:ABC-type nitrate/sulfonate/bicarbonate transport system substrate-binding protein
MAAIRLIAHRLIGRPWIALILFSLVCSSKDTVWAQERLTFSYAALGGPNSIWNIAKDVGFYQKHGLDAEVVYIASSTLSAAAVLSNHIQVGMVAGSGVVNAAASGGDLVSVACFVNVLDYELVVQPSINSAVALIG